MLNITANSKNSLNSSIIYSICQNRIRYYLGDNFYEFWFRFMSRFQALREINQKERAFEKIWQLLPDYEGFKLEALIKRIF